MEVEVKYTTQKDLSLIESKLKQLYQDLRFLKEMILPATYYDTADHRLARNHSVLRVRWEDEKWIGCYKANTEEKRVFIEDEMELLPTESQKLDWIQRLEHYLQIKKIIGQEVILPRAKIETIRKVYHLHYQGLDLEIALDQVTYHDGLSEENRVEVELKWGDKQKFSQFVSLFTRQFPELLETDLSKYQQANKLIHLGINKQL